MITSQPAPTEATTSEPRIIERRPESSLAVRLVRPFEGIDVGALFGQHLGRVFGRIGAAGLAPAGAPYARYFVWGPDVAEMEIGVPVAAFGGATPAGAESEEVGAGELPGGTAVMVELRGPYSAMKLAYQRLDEWFEETGRVRAGAPWESYVTDPGAVTDPSDLRTEVYWPVV